MHYNIAYNVIDHLVIICVTYDFPLAVNARRIHSYVMKYTPPIGTSEESIMIYDELELFNVC